MRRGGHVGLLRRQSGGDRSRKTRTLLARRFRYRYALAVAAFVGLAFFNYVSVARSLDDIHDTSRQMSAASAQLARVYKITGASRFSGV